MGTMSEQMAWNIGNDMAKELGAKLPFPPLYQFHLALETAVPNYTKLGPEYQADLIAEAATGWKDGLDD